MEKFNRKEYKYLVPIELLSAVRTRIAPFMSTDPNAAITGLDQYTVRSIYFDTATLSFYREKIEGLNIRKKVRVRTYNLKSSSTRYYLEVKKKEQRCVKKHRSMINLDQSEYIFKCLQNSANLGTNGGVSDDAKQFFFQVYRNALKPVILIAYEREAYFHKFDKNLRITFDFNLRSAFKNSLAGVFDNQNMRRSLQHNFILEIKFSTGYPRWLSRIIADFSLQQAAISKYSICLDDQFKSEPLKYRLLSRNNHQINAGFSNN